MGIEKIFFNIIKGKYNKPQLTSYSMIKAENFPSKVRNNTRVPAL